MKWEMITAWGLYEMSAASSGNYWQPPNMRSACCNAWHSKQNDEANLSWDKNRHPSHLSAAGAKMVALQYPDSITVHWKLEQFNNIVLALAEVNKVLSKSICWAELSIFSFVEIRSEFVALNEEVNLVVVTLWCSKFSCGYFMMQ